MNGVKRAFSKATWVVTIFKTDMPFNSSIPGELCGGRDILVSGWYDLRELRLWVQWSMVSIGLFGSTRKNTFRVHHIFNVRYKKWETGHMARRLMSTSAFGGHNGRAFDCDITHPLVLTNLRAPIPAVFRDMTSMESLDIWLSCLLCTNASSIRS